MKYNSRMWVAASLLLVCLVRADGLSVCPAELKSHTSPNPVVVEYSNVTAFRNLDERSIPTNPDRFGHRHLYIGDVASNNPATYQVLGGAALVFQFSRPVNDPLDDITILPLDIRRLKAERAGYSEKESRNLNEEGWKLSRAYLFERDEPLAVWESSETMIVSSSNNELFFCEDVVFHMKNSSFPDANATVQMENVMFGAYAGSHSSVSSVDPCSMTVVSPCDENTICRAMDGSLECLEPDDGMLSPLPGMKRSEYLSKYWCVDYTTDVQPVGEAQAVVNAVDLEWSTSNAYYYSSETSIVYEDGSSLSFEDQMDRPICLNGGIKGEHIGRTKFWYEENIERRLLFEFDEGPFGTWSLATVTIHGNDADPTFLGWEGHEDILIPGGRAGSIFHCDFVEFELVKGGESVVGAVLTAKDFVMAGYMEANYKDEICSLDVYNPCREGVVVGGPICHALNGKITCSEAEPSSTIGISFSQCTHKTVTATGTSEEGEANQQTEGGLPSQQSNISGVENVVRSTILLSVYSIFLASFMIAL